jgi:alpha-tubulin suppressor-like RCC1 family protein
MAWFEWGTNILHGNITAPIAVGNGLTNVTLFSSLAGLTSGIAYHYRIVATNSVGRSNGRDAIFQNLPVIVQAPAIMLSGANPVTNECHSPFMDPGAVVIAPLSAIAAGEYYSLALKTDGTVAAWGNAPSVPLGLSNMTAVAAGYISSLALKSDGTVVGWGDNSFGETNTPAGLSNVVAISSGYGYSLALKADGTLAGWGENNFTPTTIPSGLSNVVAIAAGFDLCLAAKEDGTVVGWGHPSFGGTTPPDGLSNVVAVAAGFSYGLALKSDGTVIGWGTTIPAGLSNVVAIAAGFDFSLALKSDGMVVGWGDDFYGEATPPPKLKDVIAIAAGAYHSLALKKDGTVVGWGMGFYGETDITTSGTNLVTNLPAAGFVNENEPGYYFLTYRTTNALGQVSTLNRTVVVVDTTPPTIVCPTNLTVEFINEAGTVVHFKPTATDLCSSFVSVTCVPRSGRVFPIGTTSVRCTATDVSGNVASTNFQVTVLGAQGVISNVLSDLVALSNSFTPPLAPAYLNIAISNLQQSLAPSFWIDQTHLDKSHGVTIFNDEQAAVQNLSLLIKKGNSGKIPNVAMQDFIKRIVKSDRLLALVAIQDAAKVRASPKKLAKAMQALAKGDAEVARLQYGMAIGYYWNAWNYASN